MRSTEASCGSAWKFEDALCASRGRRKKVPFRAFEQRRRHLRFQFRLADLHLAGPGRRGGGLFKGLFGAPAVRRMRLRSASFEVLGEFGQAHAQVWRVLGRSTGAPRGAAVTASCASAVSC